MQLTTTSILIATAIFAALGQAEENTVLPNPKNARFNCVGADPARARRICDNVKGDWIGGETNECCIRAQDIFNWEHACSHWKGTSTEWEKC